MIYSEMTEETLDDFAAESIREELEETGLWSVPASALDDSDAAVLSALMSQEILPEDVRNAVDRYMAVLWERWEEKSPWELMTFGEFSERD